MASAEASAGPILNGGFETGTLEDWVLNPAASGSLIFVGGHAHSGNDAVWFGAFGGADDTILETFATTPGTSYTLTFWLAHGGSDNRNGFSAWWDGTPITVLANQRKFGETPFTFIGVATGDTTTIRFSGHALQDYYYLDDVNVTAIPAPETSTFVMMLTGFATFLRLRRRPD